MQKDCKRGTIVVPEYSVNNNKPKIIKFLFPVLTKEYASYYVEKGIREPFQGVEVTRLG